MTRRELLAKSAGAAAVAVIGTGPSDVTANVVASPAAPARLEGIWPFCVRWRANTHARRDGWWYLYTWLRPGISLKTFKSFVEDGGEVSDLRLPILDLHSYWLGGQTGPIDLVLNGYILEPQLIMVIFEGIGNWPFGPVKDVDMTARGLRVR